MVPLGQNVRPHQRTCGTPRRVARRRTPPRCSRARRRRAAPVLSAFDFEVARVHTHITHRCCDYS